MLAILNQVAIRSGRQCGQVLTLLLARCLQITAAITSVKLLKK